MLGAGVVAAACSPPPRTDSLSAGARDASLTVATLLPTTGPLAQGGSPDLLAVRLAVREVNAAGGVLGRPVKLQANRDTRTDPAAGLATAQSLLSRRPRPDAVVGPTTSAVALQVVPVLSDAQVVECGASTTSPALSTIDSHGYFFRTAPSDTLQGLVLADKIAADGHRSVILVVRDDTYGRGVADSFAAAAANAGLTVVGVVPHAADTPDTVGDVSRLATSPRADAVLVAEIPSELAAILRAMIAAGLAPRDRAVYTTESIAVPDLARLVDPADPAAAETALAGLQGSVPATRADPMFLDDLVRSDPEAVGGNYAAQAYDCVTILALAAVASGSTDPEVFRSAIPGVTRGGTVCRSYRTCEPLLSRGTDIEYVGASGALRLSRDGDPTVATYELYRYEHGSLTLTAAVNVGATP